MIFLKIIHSYIMQKRQYLFKTLKKSIYVAILVKTVKDVGLALRPSV